MAAIRKEGRAMFTDRQVRMLGTAMITSAGALLIGLSGSARTATPLDFGLGVVWIGGLAFLFDWFRSLPFARRVEEEKS